jgi:PAS domain S-box-containing protein
MQVFTDLTALVVSQCQEDVDRFADHLRSAGYYIFLVRVDSEAGFATALDPRYDIILADISIPHIDVHHLLETLQERGINIPVILMCAPEQEDLAIDCLRLGASDYVCTDRLRRLGVAVGRAVESRLRDQQSGYEVERDYRMVFEQSRDIVLLVRLADGQILEANPAAEQAYGYTHDQLLNLNISDLRGPESHGMLLEQMERASQRGVLIETQHKRSDGTLFPVEISSIGADVGGQRVILSIVREISDRHRAEDQIRRLARLPEESPNPVGQIRRDGTILYANRAGEAALAPFLEDGSPRLTEKYRGHLAKVFEKAEIREFELPVGGRIFLMMLTPILDADYVNLYGRDITLIKRAEEKTYEQLEQLSALRAIDRMILTSNHLAETLDAVLGKITDLLCVDAAEILLYEPKSKMLQPAALIGLEEALEGNGPVELGQARCGHVVLRRQMEFVPDLSQVEDEGTPLSRKAYHEFTSYLALPLIAGGEIKGVLQLFQRTRMDPGDEWFGFLNALADLAAIAIDHSQLFENQKITNQRLAEAYDRTIMGWSKALDLRDHETEGHSQRVTEMSARLAYAMGIPESDMIYVRWGAMLHDIGKVGVPDQILLKPGPLTAAEWEVMRQHPIFAHELLSPIRFLGPAVDIPYFHHESWDGAGYPWGLKGLDIPLLARIFAVVDSWDALLSDRPYRTGWDPERALAYIRAQAGKQFDPEVARVFLDLVKDGEIPTSPVEYFGDEGLTLAADHLPDPEPAVFHHPHLGGVVDVNQPKAR